MIMGLGDNAERHSVLIDDDQKGMHDAKRDKLADKVEALVRECEAEGLDFVAYLLEMAKKDLRTDLDD